jgi:hypothetical protein
MAFLERDLFVSVCLAFDIRDGALLAGKILRTRTGRLRRVLSLLSFHFVFAA